MLSKPKEYISLLIEEMKKIMHHAFINYYEETFRGMCPLHVSKEKLDAEMNKVDKLRDEIIFICGQLQNNEE
jgi:hypothetical protein